MKSSIIVSIYNNANNLEQLIKNINLSYYEIILLDNASTDNSWNIIKEITSFNKNIKAIKFSNKISDKALFLEVLNYCKGDYIITLSSILDLENLNTIYNEIPNDYDIILGDNITLITRKVLLATALYKNKNWSYNLFLKLLNFKQNKFSSEFYLTKLFNEKRKKPFYRLNELINFSELISKIKDEVFEFRDFINIKNEIISEVLKETENDIILTALKTASVDLQNKIFQNMSKRAEEYLREDLRLLEKPSKLDIKKAEMEFYNIYLKIINKNNL